MNAFNARVALAALLLSAAASSAQAQGTFTQQCAQESNGRAQLRTFCERVGQAIDIAEPRIGIALTGGNPVPGTASTLGMRIGKMPRISGALRVTAALTDLPPIESVNGGDNLEFPVPSINLDAGVGLFGGFSPVPTIGGLGSVDIIASAGLIPLPKGEGFSSGSAKSWAAGARIGLLRESFTAPGIAISGMYRRLDDVTYGDSAFTTGDAFFEMSDYNVVSYRAAISKRIPLIGLGATAGVGIDRYDAAARVAVRDPSLLTGGVMSIDADNMKVNRKSAFINASWTLLVLNFVGEIGWQEGGKATAGATIPTDKLEKAGYFGGLALRIAF